MVEIKHFWGEISNIEAKQELASKLAEQVKDGQVISIGSGSTAYVALGEIAKKLSKENLNCSFVVTSYEMELAAKSFGLNVISELAVTIDWAFDGADEVDPNGNLLKGRGGAMLREKILLAQAKRKIIIADKSKMVDKLGTKFAVPCEVSPRAITFVIDQVEKLGGKSLIRTGAGKDGPVVAESGNVIIDVTHNDVTEELNNEFLKIPGLFETGLFYNLNPELL
jgi:ribose 5-phosphate isomerase A